MMWEKPVNIEIRFTDGTCETLYGVTWEQLDKNAAVVMFHTKKYPNIMNDTSTRRLGAFPLVNIQKWYEIPA